MSERLGVRDIVHGHKIDVFVTQCRTKNISPDTTEPIYANLNRHSLPSCVVYDLHTSSRRFD
jgi:hypothetical protein